MQDAEPGQPLSPPTVPTPIASPPTLTEPLPPLPTRRIESLDVLRGIAVLGILPVNIVGMAWPEAWAYMPRELAGFSPLDAAAHALVDVFATFKFITLFSLMFGAGVLMMARRNEQRGDSVYAVHYRRMGALAVIGVGHGWLLWYGDVLFSYAVCGSIVVLMRKWSARALMSAAAVSFGIGVLMTGCCAGFMALFESVSPAEFAQAMSEEFSAEAADAEIAAYTASYTQQSRYRIATAIQLQTIMLVYWSLWWAGGLMLMGMAYYKTGLITGEAEPARYRRLAAITLPIGLALTLALVALQWADVLTPMAMFTWALVPFGLVALLMSTGYLSLVMLWVRSGRVRWLRHALACTGRTALTCYLMQSVIAGFIFYSHGLGLFGQVNRAAQLVIVLIIWIVQVIAATLWLRWFPQGPMEWLWRVATYWGPPRGITGLSSESQAA